MQWPTRSQYQDAVLAFRTNPRLITVPELEGATVKLDPRRGMPVCSSGAFASVFPLTDRSGRTWALRCLTRDIGEARAHYEAIDRYLAGCRLPCFVEFRYHHEAIHVAGRAPGQRFPVILMEWVEGENLKAHLTPEATRAARAERLYREWVTLCASLREASVDHGDLQHGNVLVGATAELKLIDYDSLVVPSLLGQAEGIAGLPDYQHPARRQVRTKQAGVDAFSHLVISASLLGLAARPRLWEEWGLAGSDGLLFRPGDLSGVRSSDRVEIVRGLSAETRDVVEQLVAAAEQPSIGGIPWPKLPVPPVPHAQKKAPGGGKPIPAWAAGVRAATPRPPVVGGPEASTRFQAAEAAAREGRTDAAVLGYGEAADLFRREGYLVKAIVAAKEAASLLEAAPDAPSLPGLLEALAHDYEQLGLHVDAAMTWDRLARYRERHGDPGGAAAAKREEARLVRPDTGSVASVAKPVPAAPASDVNTGGSHPAESDAGARRDGGAPRRPLWPLTAGGAAALALGLVYAFSAETKAPVERRSSPEVLGPGPPPTTGASLPARPICTCTDPLCACDLAPIRTARPATSSPPPAATHSAAPAVSLREIGDSCASSGQCRGDATYCSSGVCGGAGASCKSNANCLPNLACISGRCTKLFPQFPTPTPYNPPR
jgi:hypothetical protein